MIKAFLIAACLMLMTAAGAHAQALPGCTLPFILHNNTIADADQVMADLNALSGCINQGIDVRNFGAKGDGSTDDTAAILSCISAPSHHCFLSPGVYVVDSLNLPAYSILDGPAVQGEFLGVQPHRAAILRKPHSVVNVGVLTCTSCKSITIRNIAIDGNAANEIVASPSISIVTYSDIHILDVMAYGADGDGIYLKTSNDAAINTKSDLTNVTANFNALNGVEVDGNSFSLLLDSVTASHNGLNGAIFDLKCCAVPTAGMYLHTTVRGGDFSYNGVQGLWFSGWVKSWIGGQPVFGPGPLPADDTLILGVRAMGNGAYGVGYQGSNGTISDNVAGNNNQTVGFAAGFAGPCVSCTWNNNTSFQNGAGGFGLDVGTSIGAHVLGGYYWGNTVGVNIGASSGSDIKNATVSGNASIQVNVAGAEESGDGYGIEGFTSGLEIQNSRIACPGDGLYGILQNNGGQFVDITNNYIQNCGPLFAISATFDSGRVRGNTVVPIGAATVGDVDYSVNAISNNLFIPIGADVIAIHGASSFNFIGTNEQAGVASGVSAVQVTNGGAGYTLGTAIATFTGCVTPPTGNVIVDRGGKITGYQFATFGVTCSGTTVAFSGGGSGATGVVYGRPNSGGFTKEITLIVGGDGTLGVQNTGNISLATSPIVAAGPASTLKLMWGFNSFFYEIARTLH